MIFIVSIILMFCFALSAVFIGFAPNVYKLTNKDFYSQAIRNAELKAMRYGEVYLRAGILDTNAATPAPNTNTTTSPFTYTVDSANVTINQVNITSNITVTEDSEEIKNITVSAE